MNKQELRNLIREEVQKELYAVLPELLKAALTDVLTEQLVSPRRKPLKVEAKEKPFDRQKLSQLLGYGDVKSEERTAPTPKTKVLAGVPVVGGLREFEARMGVSHLNDVPTMVSEGELTEGASSVAGAVPDMIVKALGNKAKQVLEETERRKNWRPGKK